MVAGQLWLSPEVIDVVTYRDSGSTGSGREIAGAEGRCECIDLAFACPYAARRGCITADSGLGSHSSDGGAQSAAFIDVIIGAAHKVKGHSWTAAGCAVHDHPCGDGASNGVTGCGDGHWASDGPPCWDGVAAALQLLRLAVAAAAYVCTSRCQRGWRWVGVVDRHCASDAE